MRDWSTANPDWEEKLLAGLPLVPELPLFADEAARALRIFKRLRIPDVIGTPTMAQACGEWFLPIVAAMFGSYDVETHRRMIQEYFLLIPKKNSKSSNGGAVMLTALIMNYRPEAEFHLIAPTMQIANIAFKQAMGTVKLDSELDKMFQIQRHIRTITNRLSGATLQIKAADTDVITGGKALGTMIDETHVFAKKSNAADIFVELRGALTSKPDGFLFQTTTQSKDPPTGVFKTELANARAVRDGEMVLPLLPVLYEFPERLLDGDQWKARKYWPLVNPNMGRSVDETFLANEMMKAHGPTGSPEQVMLIASQHFNIEIGLRLHADAWAGARHWEAAAQPGLTLDTLLERSEVVVFGGDGGGLDDLFGLGAIGRDRETKDWLIWCHAWVDRDVLELRPEIAPKLLELEQLGELTICDQPGTDIIEAAAIIERVRDLGLLPAEHGVGLDPQGVTAFVEELAKRRIGEPCVTGVTQGYRLHSAVIGSERKLKNKTIRHGGQALMAWCVGNAKVEQKGNAVLITKQASGKAKIDPLMAVFDAVVLMSRNPEATGDGGVDSFIAAMRAAA